MALSYRTRKRLALFILVIALPAYVVAAITLVGLFGRPPIWGELLVYIGLGIIWIFPLKRIFMGIGQANPDQPER